MGICAYCEQDKSLTKEHVIPNWYINFNNSAEDMHYLERSPKKFIDSAATKKDVCSACNNNALSDLDSYGKELYEQYFCNFIYAGETPEFTYNYQRLVKWLLKCTYNSARVHNTDLEILSEYKGYFITDKPLPDDLIVYFSTLSPALFIEDASPKIASRSDETEAIEFKAFRLGIFRLKDFNTINWCFRSVIINSYVFYLCVPKLSADFIKQKRELINVASKTEFISCRLSTSGQMTMPAPFMEGCSAFYGHLQQNPLTYNLAIDNMSKRVQEEIYDIIIYLIPREDIESGSTEELEDFLHNISHYREMALTYMQRIEFVIDGYNDDSRELCEIDDVVRYISKLNKIFSYWLFFQSETGQWIDILLSILAKNTIIKGGNKKNLVELDFKRLDRFINIWFLSLNELCHRCGIGETLNRKISDTFAKRLKKILIN